MAKFFLFMFTILFSLSLGLFVGQNYLLHDTLENPNLKSENTTISLNSLSLNLKANFNKLMDKIFANDDVKITEDEEFIIEPETDSPEDTFDDKPMVGSADVKSLTVKKTSEPLPTESPKIEIEMKPISENSNKENNQIEAPSEKREGWVIQVAAFQEMSDALKVEQQVKEANFPHYFYKTSINGQSWYRVNVGPFESVSDATNYKQSQKVHQKFKGAFVRKL
jgi:cell division septation protein DedD